MTVADWFSLLVERAPALRAAGVVEISLEGVAVKLAPAPPATAPAPRASAASRDAEPVDPLDAIPGYTLDPEEKRP